MFSLGPVGAKPKPPAIFGACDLEDSGAPMFSRKFTPILRLNKSIDMI